MADEIKLCLHIVGVFLCLRSKVFILNGEIFTYLELKLGCRECSAFGELTETTRCPYFSTILQKFPVNDNLN